LRISQRPAGYPPMTRPAQRPGRRPRFLLMLEPLEDRQLLSSMIGPGQPAHDVSTPAIAGSPSAAQHLSPQMAANERREYHKLHASQIKSPQALEAPQNAPTETDSYGSQRSAAQALSNKGSDSTPADSPSEYATPTTPTLTAAEEE